MAALYRFVQAVVDRRYNRRRYDVAKPVAASSARLQYKLNLRHAAGMAATVVHGWLMGRRVR
jgi:hypothetical protein